MVFEFGSVLGGCFLSAAALVVFVAGGGEAEGMEEAGESEVMSTMSTSSMEGERGRLPEGDPDDWDWEEGEGESSGAGGGGRMKWKVREAIWI